MYCLSRNKYRKMSILRIVSYFCIQKRYSVSDGIFLHAVNKFNVEIDFTADSIYL